MDDVKSILMSKTVWAGVVALVCGILGMFGIAVSPDDQSSIVELGIASVTAISGLGAIIFRYVAKDKLVVTAPPAETPPTDNTPAE